MIHSVRFTAALDTNVIYPIDIRDILLWFAHYDLYTPKWSNDIMNELEIVMMKKNIPQAKIEAQIQRINNAFPDALVKNYESLIPNLLLNDPKDCHVLAAAIKANANIIVTNNLKDFPAEYLTEFGLTSTSADDFITDIIDLNQKIAVDAFNEMVNNRRNPDLDCYQVLDRLRQRGLTQSANFLHSLL